MQVNTVFGCDFLTTLYHKQVLEAIKTLETFEISCTGDYASAMGFTCDDLLVITTSNNHHIMVYELSLKRFLNLINGENRLKIDQVIKELQIKHSTC